MKRPAAEKKRPASVDLRDLAECVEQFRGKIIVLLGDFVADEFRYDAVGSRRRR